MADVKVAASAMAIVGALGLGAVAVSRSDDACLLVQSSRNGEVVHTVLCGPADGGPAIPPDSIVIGPAGTRGLIGLGTGDVGKTADEVTARSSGRHAGRIGHSFRCAPDPDRPGKLNAACNSECAACADGQATGIAQRARLDALGIKYDCAAWTTASGCKGSVP